MHLSSVDFRALGNIHGEDPLTPSPVFCPQDHSASHSIIKGNGKFRNFKFQANPKHAKYFCISVINSAHRDCFKNPEGFLNTEGLQAHLVALIEFPDEKLASIIEFYGSEFWSVVVLAARVLLPSVILIYVTF